MERTTDDDNVEEKKIWLCERTEQRYQRMLGWMDGWMICVAVKLPGASYSPFYITTTATMISLSARLALM